MVLTSHCELWLYRCHSHSSPSTAQNIYACSTNRALVRTVLLVILAWLLLYTGISHAQITASISSLPLPIGTRTAFLSDAIAATRLPGAGAGMMGTASAQPAFLSKLLLVTPPAVSMVQ